MRNYLVSIILPVYNGARFLRQSIDSVMSQTHENFELIIVDDCSTDESPEIIAEYVNKDIRIRTIRHSQNQYLPQALNTGFQAALGDYFTWTSDDNIYKPNAIAHFVTMLSSDTEADVVYGNEAAIDEAGNAIPGYEMDTPEVIPILSCIGGYFMFKKQVYFDVGGYESEWFLVEDWQFWLKAYNAGYKFVKTEECNYLYRHSTTSLTATKQQLIVAKAIELSLRNLVTNRSKYSDIIVMRAYLKNIRRCQIVNDRDKAYECLDLAQSIRSDAINYLNSELVNWLEGK
ncbi:glycosyltransferase family 2 protein [Paenibacillus sp. y28]|uniref:glycosyltransferase family 2 protein n=1 Tax=Paenibacillus sp. y28 TaxID=3129110 RepID=UPI003016E5F2